MGVWAHYSPNVTSHYALASQLLGELETHRPTSWRASRLWAAERTQTDPTKLDARGELTKMIKKFFL